MTTVILSLLASLFVYTSLAQHPYTCCYNIYILCTLENLASTPRDTAYVDT